VATTLTGESMGELFCHTVQLVSAHGYKVSPRGQATREILDVRMRLTRPRARECGDGATESISSTGSWRS
jgi:thymidylate synthase